jgi:hypothetical protein
MNMQDKRVDLWLDSVTYIALKARANQQERSVSQHLRFLVRQDLELSLRDEHEDGMGHSGGMEGEE